VCGFLAKMSSPWDVAILQASTFRQPVLVDAIWSTTVSEDGARHRKA
jgi:hypothetical protein